MSVIYSAVQATSDKQDEQSAYLSSILAQVQALATQENDAGVLAQLQAIYTQLLTQSTAANQTTGNSTLVSILAALSGVSTASNQATANTALASILTALSGVSTAAKQDLANSLLNDIDNKIGSTASAISSVAQSTSSQAVLAANANRRGFLVYNETGQKAYLAFAATSSSSAYSILLAANTGYESAQTVVYKGAISIVWAASGSGNLRVTELT